MLTKRERTGGTWAGLGILALGIAIGALARPRRWFDRPVAEPVRERFPALVPASEPGRPQENGLVTLELVIPESSAAVLQRVRDTALERGIIQQTDADTVPAEVRFDGRREPATIRIKGDWTDHVEGERWSYRIRLDASTFQGMREFSIQAPVTRGYLWEWLVHEAARREHVLVPRSTFLNVVQNGHAMGVYFLEEHFEKELLESQGRREGPIVVWDESELWATMLAEGNVVPKGQRGFESAVRARARTPDPAMVRAFGEKRLAASDTLNLALHAAIDQMKKLRALALVEQPESDRRRVLEELDGLRGRTLEELVDVERLGCAHALLSVFQSEHALAWHNMRFYRDPVQARLEPILFDSAAQEPSSRDPVPFRATGVTAAFARSPAYNAALFRHLGRMLRSDWLAGLFADSGADLARFEAALRADGELPSGHSAGEMEQRLKAEIVYLRRACLPEGGVHFEAEYDLAADLAAGPEGRGEVEVRAWATTRSPVVLEAFRFSNGALSTAASTLAPSPGAFLQGTAVLLPVDGRSARFVFPLDERLAGLESVEKVTRAIRDELQGAGGLDLDITAVHRLVAGEEPREQLLRFRKRVVLTAEDDRPAAPELAEALELHPFLRFDFTRNTLVGESGTWDVRGDLVLPSGVGLELPPGTTLRFEQDAVLLADAPLDFPGTTLAPIVLEPRPGAETWQGIVVLSANGRCEWSDVIVRRTTAAARGGWILTGGVTLYRTPVTLRRCRFEDTQAEDALNVFGADLLFEQVTFSGAASDSFDGDFVTGEIRACTFQDGVADGIDVSGADVTVRDCIFERLGDKAFSIGERSRARILGGRALDVAIGVAAKDDSDVEVSGLAVEARHYALAAFVKKPEYGPSRLTAKELDIRSAGLRKAIAQTGCVLRLDGELIPTEAIDVEASYEEGILGRAK